MSVGGRAGQRSVVAAVAVAVVALVAWWLAPSDSPSSSAPSSSAPSSSAPSSSAPSSSASGVVSASLDPDSGLPVVSAASLPSQATDTLTAIDAGGPFRYRCCDDVVFRNAEGLLPAHERGYYREYTVTTPGSPDRGPRRIVAGSGGELYYTGDHYASFERISR